MLQSCSADLIKLEKEYETAGVDLQTTLKCCSTNQFLAPKYLHEEIKSVLHKMSKTQVISKDIKCSKPLTADKRHEFSDLVSEFYNSLSTNPYSQPRPSTKLVSTIRISSGTINVSNGDLTDAQVK